MKEALNVDSGEGYSYTQYRFTNDSSKDTWVTAVWRDNQGQGFNRGRDVDAGKNTGNVNLKKGGGRIVTTTRMAWCQVYAWGGHSGHLPLYSI